MYSYATFKGDGRLRFRDFPYFRDIRVSMKVHQGTGRSTQFFYMLCVITKNMQIQIYRSIGSSLGLKLAPK